jgi:hypothetical protein
MINISFAFNNYVMKDYLLRFTHLHALNIENDDRLSILFIKDNLTKLC